MRPILENPKYSLDHAHVFLDIFNATENSQQFKHQAKQHHLLV
jgi:hypothetical protein